MAANVPHMASFHTMWNGPFSETAMEATMSVREDYNIVVTNQACLVESVLDDLWRSNMEDQPVEKLRTAAQKLSTASLTLKVLAGALEDGAEACEAIRQLSGV